MFGIKSYIMGAIILIIISGGITFSVNRYFKMQQALYLANRQLKLQDHRRQIVEKEMLGVEKQVYRNHGIQQDAIQQILETGKLSGDSNPNWMREFETAGDNNNSHPH